MGIFFLGSRIKMLRFTVLACLVVLGASMRAERTQLWQDYKLKHSRTYNGKMDVMRREIWESNLDWIERHNVEADRGLHTFWCGENQFTDMTNDEFRVYMNRYIMRNESSNVQFVATAQDPPPASVDWREKGYVTPVKNQERCGSCWAFSTTGSLEGQHFKATQKLVSLSEQNLVDCSKKEGNKGCKGGLMDKGFEYIIKNGGIDTEESYRYKGVDGRCEFKQADVGATMKSFVDVKRGSEDALQQAIAEIGPISVAMDAGHMSFQHYKQGIYKERQCSSVKLDHGVLAVGYGSNSEGDFWIVKNSWGEIWGDKGYFMLARNDQNMCGLATQASYPVV